MDALKKFGIAVGCIIAFFFICILLKESWLFATVLIAIGVIWGLKLVFSVRIPEAIIIAVIFTAVGIFGGTKYQTVRAFFEPKTVEAASIVAAASEPTAEPPCVYQDRYPAKVVQWCHLIETEAAEYGMDPLLIGSLILIESGGQPEVLSDSGAVGLMQVMPRDGISASFQCANGPCFASRPTIAELKDPAFNVDYGTRFLSGLVDKHGDIREALKAYGPNPDDLYWKYGSYYWYADLVLSTRNSL